MYGPIQPPLESIRSPISTVAVGIPPAIV